MAISSINEEAQHQLLNWRGGLFANCSMPGVALACWPARSAVPLEKPRLDLTESQVRLSMLPLHLRVEGDREAFISVHSRQSGR